jgi:hypothetical protein
MNGKIRPLPVWIRGPRGKSAAAIGINPLVAPPGSLRSQPKSATAGGVVLRHGRTPERHGGRLERNQSSGFFDTKIRNPPGQRRNALDREKAVFQDHALDVFAARGSGTSDEENPGEDCQEVMEPEASESRNSYRCWHGGEAYESVNSHPIKEKIDIYL